jgi:hypothetical protein
MRPLLKYGVPAAAGLATGGYALSQGEDPGSAVLAGLAGGAGAASALLGGRMAGKYAPEIAQTLQEKAVVPMGNVVGNIARNIPKESKVRNRMAGGIADVLAAAEGAAVTPRGQRMVAGMTAGLGAPAAAGLAGLGGIAAGAIPGALGIPGFNQNVITDPELVGSSNTQMARTYTPTLKYIS